MGGVYSIFIKVYLNNTTSFFHFAHHKQYFQLKNRVFSFDKELWTIRKESLPIY